VKQLLEQALALRDRYLEPLVSKTAVILSDCTS
jgi:hypothetical protein